MDGGWELGRILILGFRLDGLTCLAGRPRRCFLSSSRFSSVSSPNATWICQIHVAFGLETEEKREELRKHRRGRPAKQVKPSSLKPRIRIRPSSQPPSISL